MELLGSNFLLKLKSKRFKQTKKLIMNDWNTFNKQIEIQHVVTVGIAHNEKLCSFF